MKKKPCMFFCSGDDPDTATELDLRQVRSRVTDHLAAQGDMLTDFARLKKAS
jgi:alpha-galactosidase